MAEENLPIQLNNAMPGTYEIIIRSGEALELHDPKPLSETGVITAPADFYKIRKDEKRPGTETPFFLKSSTLIRVNRRLGIIILLWDENSQFRQTITGSLNPSEYFDSLGINDYSTMRTPNELATLLKRNRFLFTDSEAAMKLIADLSRFKATVQTEVNQEKDDRGNKKNMIATSVESNIPVQFEISIPMFKGLPPEKIMVSIGIEMQGQQAVCYLESLQAKEYFESRRDAIFDEQLQVFKEDGIAIIEQ